MQYSEIPSAFDFFLDKVNPPSSVDLRALVYLGATPEVSPLFSTQMRLTFGHALDSGNVGRHYVHYDKIDLTPRAPLHVTQETMLGVTSKADVLVSLSLQMQVRIVPEDIVLDPIVIVQDAEGVSYFLIVAQALSSFWRGQLKVIVT